MGCDRCPMRYGNRWGIPMRGQQRTVDKDNSRSRT